MVSCPKCGKSNRVPASRWVVGKGTKARMQVKRFVCASCGTSYVSWADKTGKTRTMARKPRTTGAL